MSCKIWYITFAGRRYDSGSGLFYYRARYYSSELGRFLQIDPIGYADGPNLYTYVHNKPVALKDKFGRSSDEFDYAGCMYDCIQEAATNIPEPAPQWCYAACALCFGGALPSCIPCAVCGGIAAGAVANCHAHCKSKQREWEVEQARRIWDELCNCDNQAGSDRWWDSYSTYLKCEYTCPDRGDKYPTKFGITCKSSGCDEPQCPAQLSRRHSWYSRTDCE